VLDVDPDLGARLPAEQRERARAALVAHAYDADPGVWEVRRPTRDPGAFGLLVAEGMLGLRTAVDDRATLELVGRGDLLQPWVQLGADSTLQPAVGWQVIAPSRLVLLDRAFATAAATWPEVVVALMHRLIVRTRRLCYQLAVNTSPRVEDRIIAALWALADRWGRVTDGGAVLPVRLTHRQLSELVCAQRPSVSAALSRLRDEGRISYTRTSFTLHGEVPGEVRALRDEIAVKP
jgi:hypothetical protein